MAKKYTKQQKRDYKSRAQELAEAFGEDLSDVVAAAHRNYIAEKNKQILDDFIKNKRLENIEKQKRTQNVAQQSTQEHTH